MSTTTTGPSRPRPLLAKGGAAVTPHDTSALTRTSDMGLYVGTGGNVKLTTEDGDTLTFNNVPDGTLLPVVAKLVFSTLTTASNILALW